MKGRGRRTISTKSPGLRDPLAQKRTKMTVDPMLCPTSTVFLPVIFLYVSILCLSRVK